jgi:carbonic anhydrase
MEKLVHGIHRFQSNIFRPNREFYEHLATGQKPETLFITCSDSRMVPDLITQTSPGELFVMRNVGNIVPPYGSSSGAEAACIEYAVKALKVKDIIICGHTGCGAMHALMNERDTDSLPLVRDWLRHADSCKAIVQDSYSHLAGVAQWKVTVEENTLCQLENLRTHPAVASGLSAGSIKLHAWVYKMDTGEVFSYDPIAAQFLPLTDDEGERVISRVHTRSARTRPTPVAASTNDPAQQTTGAGGH